MPALKHLNVFTGYNLHTFRWKFWSYIVVSSYHCDVKFFWFRTVQYIEGTLHKLTHHTNHLITICCNKTRITTILLLKRVCETGFVLVVTENDRRETEDLSKERNQHPQSEASTEAEEFYHSENGVQAHYVFSGQTSDYTVMPRAQWLLKSRATKPSLV